ncbi:MAG: glycoside hydrolase family 27 protein, partial [Clostridia bacterium]|nr:glycoside hydrolase family 27 protein [Clostridia bacterium]
NCGRDILFSACNWGTNDVHNWARSVGAHMYRSTGDITDTFESIKYISTSQMDKFVYSGNNCFNDIDMLVTGLKGQGNIGFGQGCTDENYKYHFAFWCMASSPLMIGCDVRSLSEENKALLKNPFLIRINQDEEARPPMFSGKEYEFSAIKLLSDNEYAIGFFNPVDKPRTITFNFYQLGLMPSDNCTFKLTDVFTGEELGSFNDYVKVTVAAGDVKMFIAKPEKK